jgi:hypothetical protein
MRIRFSIDALAGITFVIAGFLSLLGITTADAMSFRAVQLSDEGSVIVATGQITEATPEEFRTFLQETYGRRNLHAVVFLDSPGGRVLASMEFGTLLRQIGAAAIVAGVYSNGEGGTVMTNGQCFSACVYAFMGARRRVVPSSSQIGIHRMFAYEQEVDASGESYLRRRYDNGQMGSVLKRYTSAMGVNPALISLAEHVPSDGLKILSRNEIRRYHLGVPHL